MQEFFDKGTLPIEDLKKGLREAVQRSGMFPVLLSSALHNIGSDAILNFVVEIFPIAAARGKPRADTRRRIGKGETVERKIADAEPLSIFVFKTLADPFAGRINYFKVMSGVLKNDATLHEFQSQLAGALSARAGDAGQDGRGRDRVARGRHRRDRQAEGNHDRRYLGRQECVRFFIRRRAFPSLPSRLRSSRKRARTKTASAWPFTKFSRRIWRCVLARDPQTKEFLLAGAGQQHIEVVVAKLRKRYHVDLTLQPPKVPYRETIRGKADAEGKHKKQTGGHGQFGVCRIKMEPLPRGKGFEFVDDIFGGAIPKNWIPSVEKGHSRFGRARLSGGLSGGGFPRDPLRRQISRRGLERHGVQDRRLARLQGSDEAGAAGAARTGHARGGLRARPVFGRLDGPPQRAARKNQRKRIARGQRGGQSAGAAFGNAQLRERADFDDARTRQLLDGVFALRLRAERNCGKSDRGAQAARRRSRRERNCVGVTTEEFAAAMRP